MSQPQHTPHTRRLVLPSGRAIEVVYFEPQPDVADAAPACDPAELHLCPECDGRLVYPVAWAEVSATQWEVDLRCPDCEWGLTGVFDQDTVDRFDAQLDDGTAALMRDLKQLTRANMEEEFERFTSALASDAIWPMDF